MTFKPVVLRHLADLDVEATVDYYEREAGEAVAMAFLDRLQTAFRAIAGQPALGSLKYGYDLKLTGLRSWQVKRYPYLVFYFDTPSNIDVWRILHAQRDIASSLHEPDGTETQ